MYTLPLSDEDSIRVRELTKVTKGGSGIGHYLFKFNICKEDVHNLKDEDIMLACGYHPLKYGEAFDHEERDSVVTFKCWESFY